MHNGTDYGGTFDVLAAADGIVVKKGSNMSPTNGYGHSLTIDHGSGISTLYAHGAHASSFKVGYRILKGEVVYRSGSTGASTGPHLHFEVLRNGRAVDPTPFFNNDAVSPTVGIPVNGRLDKTTWRVWQLVLKKDWDYIGVIDGIPGRMSWSAVQRSVVKYGYTGKIDGIAGPQTRLAVQRRLADKGFYTGKIDGIWGKVTISGIQRALNAEKY
jgi:peptidoglycan hydrolase-like protein with peptidoglycan-binding domain